MPRIFDNIEHELLPHSVIHDDDGATDHNTDVNQLIRESKDTMCATAVNVIAGDLEIILSITKSKSDHRKPQHLLFLYETGKIASDKLKEFCTFVEGSLAQPANPEAEVAP